MSSSSFNLIENCYRMKRTAPFFCYLKNELGPIILKPNHSSPWKRLMEGEMPKIGAASQSECEEVEGDED